MRGPEPDEGEKLYEKIKAAHEDAVDAAKGQTFSLKCGEEEIFPNIAPSRKSLLRNYPSAAETDEDFAYLNYLERMKKQWEFYSQASSYVWQLPEQEVKFHKVPMSAELRATVIVLITLILCVTGLIAYLIYAIS